MSMEWRECAQPVLRMRHDQPGQTIVYQLIDTTVGQIVGKVYESLVLLDPGWYGELVPRRGDTRECLGMFVNAESAKKVVFKLVLRLAKGRTDRTVHG